MSAARLTPEVSSLLASEGLVYEATLNEGGWSNGDVYLVRRGEQRLVLKTYRGRRAPFRVLGRYLLGRERRAYAALLGVAGVPALHACRDRASLLITAIDAERISNRMLAERGEAIIASLRKTLGEAHARGVYHMDLRNQGNVLVDAASQAWLVDFASAVVVRRRHPGARVLGWLCRRFDRYGFSKWARRAGIPVDP